MRCMGVHIACMTSGGRLSKRIMVVREVVAEALAGVVFERVVRGRDM